MAIGTGLALVLAVVGALGLAPDPALLVLAVWALALAPLVLGVWAQALAPWVLVGLM